MTLQLSTLLFLIIAVAGLFFYIWRLISEHSDSSRKPASHSLIIIFGICLAASIALFVDLHHFFPQMMEPAPTNTPLPTQAPSPTPTQPEELPPLIDYAEILRHSEEYSGQEVRIAGRISRLSDSASERRYIMFRDRLGHSYQEFSVNLSPQLSYETSASDYYQENQYVIVQGRWSNRQNLFSGTVISTGEDAKQADLAFMDAWSAEKYSYADTLPITNYMDVIMSPEEYSHQRIRTIGRIASVGTVTTWEGEKCTQLSFQSLDPKRDDIVFRLFGCPLEMQNSCTQGDYVLLSGVVDHKKASLEECFIESIGDDLQPLAEQFETEWKERRAAEREAYFASCQEHDYDSLARYPDKNKGERIVITGIVIQTRLNNLDDDFLLDVGQGDLVSISYYGKLYDDPEILKGDQVTFYGECCGTDTYETAQNETNTVPWIIAQYSSFNQFPS